jgi:hypothetical protein
VRIERKMKIPGVLSWNGETNTASKKKKWKYHEVTNRNGLKLYWRNDYENKFL